MAKQKANNLTPDQEACIAGHYKAAMVIFPLKRAVKAFTTMTSVELQSIKRGARSLTYEEYLQNINYFITPEQFNILMEFIMVFTNPKVAKLYAGLMEAHGNSELVANG